MRNLHSTQTLIGETIVAAQKGPNGTHTELELQALWAEAGRLEGRVEARAVGCLHCLFLIETYLDIDSLFLDKC